MGVQETKAIADYQSGKKLRMVLSDNHISFLKLHNLLRESGTPLRRPPRVVPVPAGPVAPVDHSLPPYPVFSDKWDPLVQYAWLLTYKRLAKGKETNAEINQNQA